MGGFLTRGSGFGLGGLFGVQDTDVILIVQIFVICDRGREVDTPVDGRVFPILNFLA